MAHVRFTTHNLTHQIRAVLIRINMLRIRCIMAVLFLVGEGCEEADVVDRLLDIEATPSK